MDFIEKEKVYLKEGNLSRIVQQENMFRHCFFFFGWCVLFLTAVLKVLHDLMSKQ